MRGSCDEGNQIALSEGSAKNLISKSLIPQRKHFITHRFSGVATGQLPPAAHFWRAARSVGAALWVSNTSCIIRLLILNPRVLSQAIISARKCCQNKRNAISETQISKHFKGPCSRTPLDRRAWRRVCIYIYIYIYPPGQVRVAF